VDFTSKVNGLDYRIQVALPYGPAPAKGYRALYVLDGYGYFATATEAVRGNGNAPDVVVVGIGYPTTSPGWASGVLDRHLRGSGRPTGGLLAIFTAVGMERTFDLTPPADEAGLAAQAFPGAPKALPADVGGVDDLLKIIETEIKPRVAAMARIDTGNQVLFGHSLGGLAALHALFVEPEAFRTFIIASPSIWWVDRGVLKDEPAFAARVRSGAVHPRVLVTVGALESGPPDAAHLPPGMSLAAVTEMSARARMVENGRELAARLKALHGQPPYEVADFAVFAGQNHGISAWSAMAAGIVFAFQGD
jgi:predicted alpha/beta superfamily hydrolase